jgi:hypothetical protein
MYPTQWPKVREELNFIFPPLWNLSELEEADKNTKALDNIIKALDARIITESEAIQEINARNIFSIDLTGDDMELRDSMEIENPLAGMFGNAKKFKEEEHPRADDGKFGSGGGRKGKESEKPKKKTSIDSKPKKTFGTNKKENIETVKSLIADEGFNATDVVRSGRKIDKGTAAIYNNQTGEIFVNPSATYWKNPVEASAAAFRSGKLSTDDPMGVVYHEIAHGKFNVQDNFMSLKHQQSAGKVSAYAKRNAKEFVSETYAGLKTGKKYDDEIMTMFKVYAKERK